MIDVFQYRLLEVVSHRYMFSCQFFHIYQHKELWRKLLKWIVHKIIQNIFKVAKEPRKSLLQLKKDDRWTKITRSSCSSSKKSAKSEYDSSLIFLMIISWIGSIQIFSGPEQLWCSRREKVEEWWKWQRLKSWWE